MLLAAGPVTRGHAHRLWGEGSFRHLQTTFHLHEAPVAWVKSQQSNRQIAGLMEFHYICFITLATLVSDGAGGLVPQLFGSLLTST